MKLLTNENVHNYIQETAMCWDYHALLEARASNLCAKNHGRTETNLTKIPEILLTLKFLNEIF